MSIENEHPATSTSKTSLTASGNQAPAYPRNYRRSTSIFVIAMERDLPGDTASSEALSADQVFARGLQQLLQPNIAACDASIRKVLESQADLAWQIDALASRTASC